MSQKSSVPQAVSFVSQVLKRHTKGGARETFRKPEPVPIYRVPNTNTPC